MCQKPKISQQKFIAQMVFEMRYWREEHWKEVMKCKYGLQDFGCTTLVVCSLGAAFSKFINSLWGEFQELTNGNGRKIKFWGDKWYGEKPP